MSLLILLALGLGVGLTVYEFSHRVHTRVDAYARAIRAAHDAHVAADAHLVNASAASVTAGNHAQVADATRQTPGAPQAVADAHHAAAQAAVDASADHAVAATAANQVAAKHTAEAAKNARTEAERQEVVKSAAQVLARSEKIAQALAHLGVGQCGVRSYAGVSSQIVDQLLARLRAEGMSVVGDNPWDIETHQYDVKLHAVWDPRVLELKLIVSTGEGGYFGLVTCSKIWEKIDPIMKGVLGG